MEQSKVLAELEAKLRKELIVQTDHIFSYDSASHAYKAFKSFDTPKRKVFMSNCYF